MVISGGGVSEISVCVVGWGGGGRVNLPKDILLTYTPLNRLQKIYFFRKEGYLAIFSPLFPNFFSHPEGKMYRKNLVGR